MRLFGPGRGITISEKKENGVDKNVGHINYALEDDSKEAENVKGFSNSGNHTVISLQQLNEDKPSDNIDSENETGIK